MFEFVEIMPNIYKCTIAAGRVLKYSTNIYLIKEGRAALLIDTGYASDEFRLAIKNGLEQLDIDPQQTNILVTHGHIDHYGNVDYCVSLGMRLFIQPDEHKLAITLETMSTHTAVLCGLDAEHYNERLLKASKALEHIPVQDRTFKPLAADIPYQELQIGQRLGIAGYNFEVRGYKGHSACQLCLYEPQHKFLFSADQLLLDTVPVIVSVELDQQLIKSFLAGLDDLAALDCEFVFPGHSQTLTRSGGEIEYAVALIKADYQRLVELLQGWIKEQPQGGTALDMACRLYKTTAYEYLEPRLEPKIVMLYKVFSVLEYMHDLGILQRSLFARQARYTI